MRIVRSKSCASPKIDPLLTILVVSLFLIGLLMVTSASIGIAESRYHAPFYFAIQQALSLGVGIGFAILVACVPFEYWEKLSPIFLFTCVILLAALFIPGLGRQVNGSTRWLNFGFFSFQVSEMTKLALILYLSGYLVRHSEAIQHSIVATLKILMVLGVIAILLLLEPDFGSTVVMMTTAMGMLFLGGVPLRIFVSIALLVGGALAWLAVSAPYRLQRLTSFLDPWADQYASGYQLTQALIAFGRGEWFGVGLGSSIQKLFYLPEAHTDFIFAVLAEEFGLVGAIGVVLLLALVAGRAMWIGFIAQKRQAHFHVLFAFGIALWIGIQTLINVGVNTGLLPTKGLTLPFLSYGRTSTVVLCMALGMLFRIDYENRRDPPIGRIKS